MKLNQVSKLLISIFLLIAAVACNSDDETTYTYNLSSDAQIYSFALTAKAYNAVDSATYPVLGKTRFAIDRTRNLIYNPDSLPHDIVLKKFYATVSFGNSTPRKVELVYPKDSVVEWTTTDSIDFSTPLYPRFRVTALDENHSREYTVELRIHKIDPDSLIWDEQALRMPSNVVWSKTLLKDDEFYTFSKDDPSGKFYLRKASKSASSYEMVGEITSLPNSLDVISNIVLFDNKFFTTDPVTKQSYSSDNGVDWALGATGVYSVLGILPDYNTGADSLLLIADKDSKPHFAKTIDLTTLKYVRELSEDEVNDIPMSGFSSVTQYDDANQSGNILAITGGKTIGGALTNATWAIQVDDRNVLRIAYNNENRSFAANAGIATFLYDSYLYALTIDGKLYKSSSFGYKWQLASVKESLTADMPKNIYSQSVIVDTDNYIWLFGGKFANTTYNYEVWRGRINRLSPKK